MKHLILRKGKKVIKSYPTAYDMAEDTETLKTCFPRSYKEVKSFVAQNAFTFAIVGAKAKLGNGYIAEMRRAEV